MAGLWLHPGYLDKTGGGEYDLSMQPGERGRWDIAMTAAAALLLGFHGVLAWANRSPGLTTGGDDATYLFLARALRDFNYRELFLIGEPWHAQYPPMFPAWLALVSTVGGERIDLLIATNIAFSLLALASVFLAVRRQAPFLALGTLAVAALNPSLIAVAGGLRSEPLFLAATAAALAWAGQPRRTGLAIAAVLIAALTRSIGVTVVAALIATWWLLGRRRAAVGLAIAAAVTVGPWLGWTMMAPNQYAGRSYIADFQLSRRPGSMAMPAAPGAPVSSAPSPLPVPPSTARPDSSPSSTAPPEGATRSGEAAPPAGPAPSAKPLGFLALLGLRVVHNAETYAARGVPDALALPRTNSTDLDNWAWLAVIVIGGAVGLWRLARGEPTAGQRAGYGPAAAATVVAYGGLLAIWPYPLGRFLIPMIPWLALAILVGLATCGRWLDLRWPRARLAIVLPALVTLLGLTGAAAEAASLTARRSGCDRANQTESPGCFDSHERAFFAALRFIADSTPSTSRLLTAKESVAANRIGRPVVSIVPVVAGDGTDLERFLASTGVDLVLLSHLKFDESALAPQLERFCQRLVLVRRFGSGTMLFRVGQRAHPEPSAACQALRDYQAVSWEERGPRR